MTESKKYFYGLGRRKSAIAQVRIYPGGTGKVTINGTIQETPDPVYVAPLLLVGQGTLDVTVVARGGGFQGQKEAIRHGISRALLELDAEFRSTLKKSGFLTRDPRVKERQKYGLRGARRAPQWSKR